jgi:hypothetical protein
LPDTDLAQIAETNVNPDLLGRRFVYAGQGSTRVANEGMVAYGSYWVGAYVRSIRNTLGEHWIELRLVEQGPGTAARLGSVYSLRADRVKEAVR